MLWNLSRANGLALGSILLLAACARDEARELRLRLQVALDTKADERTLVASSTGDFPLFTAPDHAPARWPGSFADFQCIGVNVMGPGIAASGSAPNKASMDDLLAGSRCAYPGILSDTVPIPTGASTAVQLQVRALGGPNRIIQIIGIVNDGSGCPTASQLTGQFTNIYGIYELARVKTNLQQDGQVIALTASYTETAPREVRCESSVSTSAWCALPSRQTGTEAGGAGNSLSPFLYCSASQLIALSTDSSRWSASKFHKLRSSIFTSSGALSTIGQPTPGIPFSGSFDGDGHRIVYSKSASGASEGLFGKLLSPAAISNLKVTGTITGSANSVGILAGTIGSGTSITDCATSGSVTGGSSVGGLVGQMSAGTITRGTSSASVSCSGNDCGGLVGQQLAGSITSSGASGAVSGGSSSEVGGLVGSTNGSIATSVATGSVTVSGSGADAGGFVGRTGSSSAISESYASGNVSGRTNVGGFVGYHVGNLSSASMTNCYSTGSAAASVTAGTAGGFAGSVLVTTDPSLFQNLYTSTSNVTGATVGSFSGDTPTSYTRIFSNNSVAPVLSGFPVAGDTLVAKSPTGLITQSTYGGFNFTSPGGTWAMVDGVSAPTLQNVASPPNNPGATLPARNHKTRGPDRGEVSDLGYN